MGRTPGAPPSLPGPRPGVVWPVRIDPAGITGPTRGQARSARWRGAGWGFHVPADVDGSRVEQRIVEAAMKLGPHGGVTGWAALRWCGGSWFTGERADGTPRDVWLDVDVGKARSSPGVRVTEEALCRGWVTQVDGLRVAVPAWAALTEMRFAPSLERAVVAADMAAYDDLVSRAEVDAMIQRAWARTGIPQARAACALMSESAWSPAETMLRCAYRAVPGLPAPLANAPVFASGGRLLGTPDLLVPGLNLGIDYDGEVHLESGRRHGELMRAERFRDHGLHLLVVMKQDLRDPVRFRTRLGRAITEAARLTSRTWTAEPPRWWVRTDTVERRRALTPAQRQRLLRYRESR